jgi:ribonuclease-3
MNNSMINSKVIDFSKFEEYAGIFFKDKQLLRQAFVHRSYLNENKTSVFEHNERLEFLGDAVLELIVTEYLFKKFPGRPEGELTAYRSALVNANTLASVAEAIHVNDFLLLSKGEAKDKGRARQVIMANAMESIIGAIFMDSGYGAAEKFVAQHILPLTEQIIEQGSFIDSKSLFQEKAQENTGITPAYKTTKEEGPDHSKVFTVGVYLETELVVEGTGKSKQEAEQSAAQKALQIKGW